MLIVARSGTAQGKRRTVSPATRPSPAASQHVGHRNRGSTAMSKGDKSSYTDKQKRQAQHIEESEKKEGKSKETAERIAWATVNKQDGGCKK
jgi:hypothetical protein